jgi:hypothetical protein
MRKRLVPWFLAAALAGCGKSNEQPAGAPDMVAGTGGVGVDLAMVLTTTIAGARTGNVTTPITVNAVVTAIQGDDPVDTTTWYIQDPQGGPNSGIAVYCNHGAKSNPCPAAVTTPKLHDLITITGTITAYRNVKLELNPTAQTTIMANAAAPPVATVSATDLLASGVSKSLHGTMVKLAVATTVDSVTPTILYNSKCAGDAGVNGLCSGTSCTPSYYGFEVVDSSGNQILVENSFHDLTALVSSPECAAAQGMTKIDPSGKFDFIQGILDVDPYIKGSTPQILMPTAPSDFAYHL